MIDSNSGNQTGVVQLDSMQHSLVNGQKVATGSPVTIKKNPNMTIFILAAFGTVTALTEGGVETGIRPSGVLVHPLRFDKEVVITGQSAVVYFEAPST